MSLQIVVAVEGLWALVTLEGSVILLLLLAWMMSRTSGLPFDAVDIAYSCHQQVPFGFLGYVHWT